MNTQKNSFKPPRCKFKNPRQPSKSKVASTNHHSNRPIQADMRKFQCSISHLTIRAKSSISNYSKWHQVAWYQMSTLWPLFLEYFTKERARQALHKESILKKKKYKMLSKNDVILVFYLKKILRH